MLTPFRDSFKIPDLRKKILITLVLLAVYRLGCYIPTPGIDGIALAQFFRRIQGTLFGIADLFTGGALSSLTILALGIMPYISVSIILELLAAVVPYFENLRKEGPEGRRKLTQLTRRGTVLLCIIQATAIAFWLENPNNFDNVVMVSQPGWFFRILTVITLTAGTIFLMWLGEQITEKGIGNGISLIITVGILSRYPSAAKQIAMLYRSGQLAGPTIFLMMILIALVVAATILLTEGERRISVQYPKRIVGRKVYGGQSTYLPIKINQGGVIPLIFAVSILMLPATMLRFVNNDLVKRFSDWLSPGAFLYTLLYAGLTVFFCYFYSAISFNPDNVADDLRKYGGFIAGVRPGKPTANFLEKILTRLTLPGSLFLVAIAIFPYLIMNWLKVPYLVASLFGGIGLLIIVAVIIETMRQIESHLLMRHYQGFMKKMKIR
ncbi:MAG: preprotein translocase subunit SecY [bacterium (Candidatus Ratteibacteria) CG_4_10_14_3_um_filter_41_18]|uniref:Protein translocase subunit SecY n=4 Tax=Candidatus Ratteibacteria TaxID=2979319 RepID=A0A2M7EA64_9BACT|nr:MAG: preprotein translocase subunit SecY [Candidatus Omnitrophica bacterium CG1_02_41_171]PIV64598.1 MAG: preprotein translocase subunit SecY [bacterium (Candidatus Ratteibacteria) CG01_land_8_20_14_3_00_40_19]PIW32372.1 MAG: preprotein translocase subunit SecY [bacterium (Candidatus Ratteibacteria) CG15_BIG_FIL_POST_REV_8_21_14_020_41_12]PIW73970.1 MAG: preprotein translocase subunit SecY [bacterium (Candidatus Ratteibacteria) CG_4_8_14_3_um_filter_41_36]PIX77432.1 MAG: preprotein transloca